MLLARIWADKVTREHPELVDHLGTQRIVGLTVMHARQVLDRDGRLIVTVPETVGATAGDLAPALQAA